MTDWRSSEEPITLDLLLGDGDPAAAAGHTEPPPRVGFFTDTSLCIGCKA